MKKINLETELDKHLNFKSFKPGQKEIIELILKGKDVLGVLPTGSGKSLCYQLPAKILPGLTVVISPLTSLMIDQVKELKAIHYKRVAAFNGMVDWTERNRILNNISTYKLLYISPELFQSREVINALQNIKISLIVIDEAHCISQWGYDFRPDYLRLINNIKLLENPPILALTATASHTVRSDIKNALSRPDLVEVIYPIDRENIIMNIEKVTDELDKQQKIIDLLTKNDVPTLIYFSSRKKSEEVAAYLTKHLNREVAYYHGGLENSDRLMVQQQFMNNQLNIICCTTAFGMGINKKDIRLVIHYHLPLQIESYIQEIGRAGRDGKESVSILYFSQNDIYLPLNIIENQFLAKEELTMVLRNLSNLEKISKNERDMETHLAINETQWKNLKYQLENHGMIKEGKFIKNETKWLKFIQLMIEQNESQELIKQNDLRKLVEWASTDDCLRVELYKSFQSTLKTPLSYCCSSCDFDVSQWYSDRYPIKQKNEQTWQSKLAEILQIGENYETS
ncbi:MAG TPA: RecQ family ATP-dependent DNA helicase [Pseudogracilibacillus sp.]|nr:RecQ family ATP-dependent DNA helicase [Pseudogracilibacillus sp.]